MDGSKFKILLTLYQANSVLSQHHFETNTLEKLNTNILVLN